MQFQAGYMLESVREKLIQYTKNEDQQHELQGLLQSLSTFDVQTTLSLECPQNIPNILAVAVNIITRGLPTLPTIYLETYFADKLGITTRKDIDGKITFPAIDNTQSLQGEALFKALHVIDPRARNRRQYLELNDLDSSFERNFLLTLIPEAHSYLPQLLEKQRSRASFTRDNNQGRVDFSMEIPYNIVRKAFNRFNQNIAIKHHDTYIIEVDGERYHTDVIDDLKDLAIGQLARNISHIREKTTYNDIATFIKKITVEPYVQITADNYHNKQYLSATATALALSPFIIARVQRVLLQYLLVNYLDFTDHKEITLAVIERDLPGANAAVEDLLNLLHIINDLSQLSINIPEIKLTVFSSQEYRHHPLRGNALAHDMSTFNAADFDLVIDVSVLQRTGIFRKDEQISPHTIVIRSAHYIHYTTDNCVLSALPITYRQVVIPLSNEEYEEVEPVKNLLIRLVQDIFRKTDFRKGQLPILNRAMQLQSVIGLLPTGGGKSLTYQLAGLLQPGMTIVVDPIRSLMLDQYNGLREIGIDKCEFINSTLSTAERNYNQHELLAKGQLQFLFVSPERFVIDDFRTALANAAAKGHYFAYAVIDEVHCVSEWGHDFRTPYLNLGDNAQEFCQTSKGSPVPLFGLTATASFDVLADIERELNIKTDDGNAVVRFENSIRDEINYIVEEVHFNYDGLEDLDAWKVREYIGNKKQLRIFDIINKKAEIFEIFNNERVIRDIISHSYQNYLPLAEKSKLLKASKNEDTVLHQYTESMLTKLYIPGSPFSTPSSSDTIKYYPYGLIVFMPHRRGWLGIHSTNGGHGLFDKPGVVNISSERNATIPTHHFQEETLGYFMGSGDDDAAGRIDKESFYHLDQFKKNQASIMVATKAFGMGIDKPDVRMTIHINIPSSIESFVQEAGRGGRDGKLSTSLILYHNNVAQIGVKKKEAFHLDKDVLMYFHKNSFKGQVKERVMIHELRNTIIFPVKTNLQLLVQDINELYGNNNLQFNINLGETKHHNRIFINLLSGEGLGYVYLDTGATGILKTQHDTLSYNLVDWLKGKLPIGNGNSVADIRSWLDRMTINSQQQTGIERMLMDMDFGDSKKIPIPFTNRFYSPKTNSRKDFYINTAHYSKVLETTAIKQVMTQRYISLPNILADAVYEGDDYLSFIERLNIQDESLVSELNNELSPMAMELQKAYYIARSQDDTAKAIYRLISIGIIDSYTIDYQNGLYTVTFTRKRNGEYYNSLEQLIARYTSRNIATQEIRDLRESAVADITSGKATEISKCLEYLTTFIYHKIKEKRLLAIEDMIRLCQAAITIKEPLKQSHFIKDEIYYYFNAKYSRRGFVERTATPPEKASMPDDLEENMTIGVFIDKYLGLVENGSTGEFISNIKHLRGSTMRMLRSKPGSPQLIILKSFSLFILADAIVSLLDEAKREFAKGLIAWKREQSDLDVTGVITAFRERVYAHIVNYNVADAFEDIEDLFYAQYYAEWTGKFNKQFLVS